MSVEIKVYLTNEQIEDNLCFHANINAKDDYDIFFDLNEAYEPLMIEALNGELTLKYHDRDNYSNKNTFGIKSDDYKKNLESFVDFLNDFYGLTAILKATELCEHFGVILMGAGFRGNQNSPMLENAQFNSMNSIHGIKTQLFSANNTEYRSDDVYIKKAHGSLRLTLEATKKYEEPIAFIRSIYDDIENEQLNPFKLTDKKQQYRYQTIIKNLNDLNSQKRLKEFYVIIDGQESKITKREYLRKKAKDIYKEPIEIVGIFEAYKQRSKSLEIYSEGIGKLYCHLKSLYNTNANQYENVLSKLKGLDSFETARIKVFGNKTKPQTIDVTNIELID